MTTGEVIKNLITAENYTEIRMTISDEFIGFIREMMPHDYEYFAEKEAKYQDTIKLMQELKAGKFIIK